MRIYDVKKDYILDYVSPAENIIPLRNSFIKIKGYFIKKRIELIEEIISKIRSYSGS